MNKTMPSRPPDVYVELRPPSDKSVNETPSIQFRENFSDNLQILSTDKDN